LAEAGYRPNNEGILEKAGQPLRFSLLVSPNFTTDGEVLSEQFKAIGADVPLEVQEQGLAAQRFVAGDYQLMLIRLEAAEADLLYLFYHGTKGMLPGRLSEPDLDAILDKTRSAVDPAARQEWVNQAQARIVEQAYMLPLYAPTVFTAVSQRVTGLIARPDGSFIYNEARIK
jgi:peptide/nickel transport system substrate-binding protein